jgi:hypothetical protein
MKVNFTNKRSCVGIYVVNGTLKRLHKENDRVLIQLVSVPGILDQLIGVITDSCSSRIRYLPEPERITAYPT